jgi:DNA-binding NtrC family response regulator
MKVAEALGIDRRTLSRKLKQYREDGHLSDAGGRRDQAAAD